MKQLIQCLLLTTIISLTQSTSFGPWWLFLIVAFIAGMTYGKHQSGFAIFVVGFFAGLLSWMGYHLLLIVESNNTVSELLKEITGLNMFLIALGVGIIGGILSGLAHLSGHLLVKAFRLSKNGEKTE